MYNIITANGCCGCCGCLAWWLCKDIQPIDQPSRSLNTYHWREEEKNNNTKIENVFVCHTLTSWLFRNWLSLGTISYFHFFQKYVFVIVCLATRVGRLVGRSVKWCPVDRIGRSPHIQSTKDAKLEREAWSQEAAVTFYFQDSSSSNNNYARLFEQESWLVWFQDRTLVRP